MTMTSLWRNVSVNVVSNSNWRFFYLLISVPKFRWKVQPTAARRSSRFNMMQGAVHTLHVSQQCLHENCPQMLEKEQRPPNNSPNLNETEISCLGLLMKLFWKLHPKPRSFWIKNHTREDMGEFSAGPINKSVQSFTSSLTRVRERWWKTF